MPITRRRIAQVVRRGVRWGYEKLPPGVRTLLGLPLIVGGVFGFLPILGFWMIPLGAALVALDLPPLRRRLLAWVERSERRERGE